MSTNPLVLPRPGAPNPNNVPPIAAPSEESFVAAFGQLLPRASYLDTPNGRAAYYELSPSASTSADGAGRVSRVLLVHGVQTPAVGLQPLASELSSRFPHAHIVLVDLWGHGLTDTPFAAHEPALFYSLLEAVLVKLGWKDAHFIGFSFGGATTATFAAAYPERFASMVLVAPAGLMKITQFDEVERSYLAGGEGLEERVREWVPGWLEGGELVVPSDWRERVERGEVVAEAVRDWENKEHKGHVASVVGVVRDGGVLDKHAEFAEAASKGIKNLSILGELDGVCKVEDLNGVGFQNVAVVEKAGHGVVRERVPEVAQLIEDFWKTL